MRFMAWMFPQLDRADTNTCLGLLQVARLFHFSHCSANAGLETLINVAVIVIQLKHDELKPPAHDDFTRYSCCSK